MSRPLVLWHSQIFCSGTFFLERCWLGAVKIVNGGLSVLGFEDFTA
jgi:hypothetical protein